MVSNVARRNVCLMMAVAFFCGVIYCLYEVIHTGSDWVSICPVIIADAIFLRMYLCYRRQVKQGNIYGKVNLFK